MALLDAGTIDCIVIAKLDRLTRSVSDWQFLIDHYFSEKAGKRLCSVNDSIDTHTASGRLVLNILMSVAQWEREAISERTKEALGHKIKNGERCGRVRYGYSLAADGVNLDVSDYEQQTLSMMRSMREQGYTYRYIAEKLELAGRSTRNGTPWGHSTIRSILTRGA